MRCGRKNHKNEEIRQERPPNGCLERAEMEEGRAKVGAVVEDGPEKSRHRNGTHQLSTPVTDPVCPRERAPARKSKGSAGIEIAPEASFAA
jgi:hypothetical protein